MISRDLIESFKATDEKVEWLEQMRGMLAGYDVNIDGLIKAWKKKGKK